MLRLNIRQTWAMMGMHMKIDTLSSHVVRPEAHTEYVAPRSNMGVTLPRVVEVDTYPSRHAYGFTNHEDFAREQGQRGKSDLRATVSKHTQHAWAMIDNAARKGHNEIRAEEQSRISQQISKQRYIDAQAIPDPIVRIAPGELKGTPDPGKVDWTVDVPHWADVQYNRGYYEGYYKQQANVRQWVTEDRYDIYA